ncbi:MAG: AAA family ATPase [Candidatus Woesearchaeota archaeon]
MARSIAIVSLGQGTGKTTIALNLGVALNNLNQKVLVYDSDFTKKNMLDHLDIYDIPTDISEVLNGNIHINDAIYNHVSGIKLLLSKIHNSDSTGYDTFSYHYQDLIADYDYILIDAPTNPSNLNTVLENADEAIIVHDPNYSSKIVMDIITMLNRLKVINLGIVLNNVSKNSVDTLFSYPVLEKIPVHKDILKSYNLKNPLLHTHPKSKVAKHFNMLAKRLV